MFKLFKLIVICFCLGISTISLAYAESSDSQVALAEWEKESQKAQQAFNDGNYSEAQKKWTEALNMAEKAQKVEPGVVTCLIKLALTQDKLGHSAEAERLYELAMRHMEGLVGVRNQRFGDLLPELAELYGGHGKNAQAEELYKKLLNIRQSGLSKDDPKIADAYEAYVKFLRKNNRSDEAEILTQHAKSIRYKQDMLSK